ncbi:MAG: hypothetical protein OFPII_04140 [Osedax symbiont Rs1]|nr:MAG: hypothetical protein OFPII_08040 [Osedax symbiont Rs1]EPJ48879.1 MAG: hypothetical protein OFPII_04140 [Osedax symbiont Rs1]
MSRYQKATLLKSFAPPAVTTSTIIEYFSLGSAAVDEDK